MKHQEKIEKKKNMQQFCTKKYWTLLRGIKEDPCSLYYVHGGTRNTVKMSAFCIDLK